METKIYGGEFSYDNNGKPIPNPQKPYVLALFNNDKELAKELTNFISKTRKDESILIDDIWKVICNKLGYCISNAFENGDMSSHFKRVLNELKILSVFGKHSWTWWNDIKDDKISVGW